MRASHLAVGVVVVSLLVVAAASAPAAAQIEGTDQEETAICGDAPSGNSLVLVLPGDTYVYPSDQRALLPGTTGELAFCSDGELQTTPAAWDIDNESTTGLRVTGESDYGHTVTITPVDERTPVGFGATSGLEGSIKSPSVNATPGRVMTVGVDGNEYSVTVANDSKRQEFEEANTSYTATLEEIREAATDLNGSAHGENGLGPNASVPDDERLPQINQTQAVTANYSEIQSLLFSSATSGNTDAVAALDSYEDRNATEFNKIKEELGDANDKIDQQTRSTAFRVLRDLLGVLLVGAVGGGVGGRFLTNRILSKVEIDRRRSSAVEFSPRHLAIQLGGALVLIAGAVLLVVTQGLLDPLVAVFRAVIGV
jgi:hypothetical protein